MQLQATFYISADQHAADAFGPSAKPQTSIPPSDEINFLPHDNDKPMSPEDIGMPSLEKLVSNVHALSDYERQDRFFFEDS